VKLGPEIAAALVACTRRPGESSPALDRVLASGETAGLVVAARGHRVLAQTTASLRASAGAPPELLAELEQREVARTVHQLKLLDDLRLFDEAMRELGASWLVFKGPVIAHTLYARPELRSFQDVDVLLAREGFAATLEGLEAHGFRVLDRNWTLIGREQRGQLHLQLRLGSVADVHWHLLNRASVRTAFPLSMASIVGRRRPVELDGLTVATLDPVDTLVHLCLHAALGGADRLLWLSDVMRAVETTAPPWDDVVARAREWRAGPSTALVLRRARQVLDADVPDHVLAALEPSRLRVAVGRRLERRTPVPGRADGRSAPALWSQILRDGNGRTARAGLTRALRPAANIVHRLRGEPTPDREVGTGAILEPAGGDDARRAYLRGVDPTFDRAG
jgi:putative nucleotidyltransferase-like protein